MVVKVLLENADLNQTSDDETHSALNQTGDDSVIHLPLWRFVTAICLRLGEATGVPILQHRLERFSAWHFAHGFNVLRSPFRNIFIGTFLCAG